MADNVQKIREEVERLINQKDENKYLGIVLILELKKVLSFIDSLQEEPVSEELKKVDLENIAAVKWDDYIRKIDGEPDIAYMLIKRNEYIELAKHFFELGIKAQKGE